MSEKRTSAESRIPNDDETTEDVFRQVDNTKRGKFVPFSDTTLQDIPTEILQCILIKAVAMEVKNMKLAKKVWKEKADLVISRLENVCSQWSNVFATDFFRIELHRALDGTSQEKFRMERVQELHVDCRYAHEIATLKDDIFLLCLQNHEEASKISSYIYITVYDRNNIEKGKNVIALPGLYWGEIAACNVSNCVYVLKGKCDAKRASVLRITKDDDQKFNVQSWISDLRWRPDSISVSDEGRVILISRMDEPNATVHPAIIVYNPDGFLHQEVDLPRNVYGFDCSDCRVIRRPNGNLVLAAIKFMPERHVDLTEVDTNGIIQRQCKSSLRPMYDRIFMSFADAFGRIIIHDKKRGIEVLDSELNLLESMPTGMQWDNGDDVSFDGLDQRFNRERNEVLNIWSIDSSRSPRRILRLGLIKE